MRGWAHLRVAAAFVAVGCGPSPSASVTDEGTGSEAASRADASTTIAPGDEEASASEGVGSSGVGDPTGIDSGPTSAAEDSATTGGTTIASSGDDDTSASTSSTATDGGSSTGGVPITCGDGVLDPGEACDPGVPSGAEVCTAACTCIFAELAWDATLDVGVDNAGWARDVHATNAGTWLVGGARWYAGGGPGEAFVRELDGDGIEVGGLEGFAPGPDSHVFRVAEAPDGTVLVAGVWDWSAVNADGCGGWFATAFAPGGAPLWTLTEPQSCLYTRAIEVLDDGTFVLAGEYSGFVFSRGDLKVVDPAGDVQWSITEPGDLHTAYRDVAVLADDTIVVARTEDDWDFMTTTSTLEAFALDGSPLWSHELAPDPNGTLTLRSIEASGQGLRLAGSTSDEKLVHRLWLRAFEPPDAETWTFEPPDLETWPLDLEVLEDGSSLVLGAVPNLLHVSADGLASCEWVVAPAPTDVTALALSPDGPAGMSGWNDFGVDAPWAAALAP